MISQIAKNSMKEGRRLSRLPIFTNEWIEKIRGSADFLGLNYYTSRYVEIPKIPMGKSPSYERDFNIKEMVKTDWKPSASESFCSVPQGFGDILRYKQYVNINTSNTLKKQK